MIFHVIPQVWVDIFASEVSQDKIYAHTSTKLAATIVQMPNLLPPAGPTLMTQPMLTTHIKQLQSQCVSPVLPKIASLLYWQGTANTHVCSKSAQHGGSEVYGTRQLCCAGTVSATLSKSIRLHLHTRHGHDQGFWMHGSPDRFIAC